MRSIILLLLFAGVVTAQPKVDPTKPLARIAFGSCADQDKPCPAWEAVLKSQPELLLLLGDTIYADLDKSKKVTTELIREKYQILDQVPAFKSLKTTVPMLGIWDDHDYGKNDADGTWHLKDESQQVLLDFYNVPKNSPRRSRKGVFYSEIYGPPGKRVQVILLDVRYHSKGVTKGKFDPKLRTTPYQPNTADDATFLGAEQWTWLAEQLKEPAEIRFICSGIQVLVDEHPYEKWSNLPNERARLFKTIRDSKANGVIFLSGDRHLGELSLSTEAISYPLYDFTCSGFNQATLSWRPPEKNRYRVASLPYGNHFGLIEIDWASNSPRISLQVRSETGDVLIRHDIRAGLLTVNEQSAKPSKPLPEGVISPEQALTKVGDEVKVQFEVKAGNKSRDGTRVFLNSDADFKSEKNFTVVLTGRALSEGQWKDAKWDDFKGKTIRVTGKVTKYQEKPQIVVEEEKRLEVVE